MSDFEIALIIIAVIVLCAILPNWQAGRGRP